ncbi:MAG: hypothetical protein KGL43_13345 [Burkholderiales bacterium]|nr:hypothetical protein [Burkholderiales bacterium]MDE2397020.1 hypothetical protein [Burkholderiales bacterium]MDE2454571.1 hypothetical protein [Burkholderiales bacterium]
MTLTRLGRLAAYIISFALARGALFAAPLLLANLLTSSDYGLLETAQAAASLLANVAVFGTASVVPLVLLDHTRTATMAGIVTHHLALLGACAAVGIAAVFAGAAHSWGLAALFCAVTAMQSLGSTHLKTQGRSEASVLLDAGHFGLMALAAGVAHFAGADRAMPWVVGAALIYVTLLGTAYLLLLARLPRNSFGQWRAAIGLGLPLMLGGVVTLLATTSGRLGMGLLAGPLVAADYAVLSRAAALPIVAHQLILVARFRNLFTLPNAEVERAAAHIVMLVAASAFAFCLLAPWLGRLLGPAFVQSWSAHPMQGAWIAAQAVLWSAIALNDLVIVRHQVMPRILPMSAGFLGLEFGVGWFSLHRIGATLEHFVFAHGLLMLLFYGVQSAAMAACGIRLNRVWARAACAYVAMVVLATTFS